MYHFINLYDFITLCDISADIVIEEVQNPMTYNINVCFDSIYRVFAFHFTLVLTEIVEKGTTHRCGCWLEPLALVDLHERPFIVRYRMMGAIALESDLIFHVFLYRTVLSIRYRTMVARRIFIRVFSYGSIDIVGYVLNRVDMYAAITVVAYGIMRVIEDNMTHPLWNIPDRSNFNFFIH